MPSDFNFQLLAAPKSDAGGSGFEVFKKLTLPDFRRTLAAMASRKTMLSREEIHAMRGKFKLNLGDKSFAEWMADLNREEKELEERKFQRLAALGKKSIIHHES